ncbi:MAG: hypothetical protein IPK93_04430 [Solirubrobacterales bacterium]|nr:hypothetical protein [Solirubrobacterales bacterium]
MAALFVRWPLLLPVLVIVAIPFRVPIQVGGEEANLLMPLYLVMAGGVAASGWRQWFTPEDRLSARPEPVSPAGIAAWLKPLLAATVLLFAIGLFWSDDRSTGLQNLCFFLVPFAVIFALMVDFEWTPRRLRIVLITVVAVALVCALVGFVEHFTRELLWNEAVIRTNDFHVYFRVNSLFWDPNVYGRYLALAITIIAAALIWSRDRKETIILCAVTAILWLALVTTFSQSSFVALLAGLATLAALRWSFKWVGVGLIVLAAGTLLFGTVAGGLVKLDLSRLNAQTAGRPTCFQVGSNCSRTGRFSVTDRAPSRGLPGRDRGAECARNRVPHRADHDRCGAGNRRPGRLRRPDRRRDCGTRRRHAPVMPGLSGKVQDSLSERGPPAARAAVIAAFIAVLVHTITYAGFLDDPITWVLIAIGYSLAFPCRATSAA